MKSQEEVDGLLSGRVSYFICVYQRYLSLSAVKKGDFLVADSSFLKSGFTRIDSDERVLGFGGRLGMYGVAEGGVIYGC